MRKTASSKPGVVLGGDPIHGNVPGSVVHVEELGRLAGQPGQQQRQLAALADPAEFADVALEGQGDVGVEPSVVAETVAVR